MMSLAEFHFIRPYWLLALIPALFITILLLKNKLSQGNWTDVCDDALLPFVLQEKPVHRGRWSLSIATLASVLIIISLAGPTWERLPAPVFRNDAALVIALDLSRSMDATDIKPSRLSRAHFKIADILKQRKDGQTALLVYAGDAFTVTPLTEDTETIASQISALTTTIMPSPGSNTTAAIDKAIELLTQAGLQQGEILLMTDHVDIYNTMDKIESLKGYRLSILGIGTAEGAPIKVSQGGFLKDKQGNIVVPKLNSSELSQLARKANGVYKQISSDDSDIEALLDQFDNPLEKQGAEDNKLLIDQWNEKGPWLLLLALPLAAFSFRKGLLSVALLVLLPFPETSMALEWNDLWETQNQQAQQAYKQENYPQAAEQFDNLQWKAAAQYKSGQFELAIETLKDDKSSSGLYNLGNALAQSGKLEQAIAAYEQSLQKDPQNEDAQYNKEQVEKELEKQQQNQQQGDQNQQSDNKDAENKENKENKKDQQDDKSEQSDKKNGSDQESDSEQPEEQQAEENSETEESEKAEQHKQEPADESEEAKESEAQQAESSEYDESQQANEQWLKRIPDDPAGLLKRKFKYQYGKRENRNSSNNQDW